MRIGNIINTASELAIKTGAALAGSVVGVYAINHDVMNDEDVSAVVGITAGVGTYVITKNAMLTVKNGTVNGVNKLRTKLNRKSKGKSVQ